VSGLSKRVTDEHLRHIFGFYGPSLSTVKKDHRNYDEAAVAYSNRKDALYALEHLSMN
jgi:RNA recognition motif. (a.k.a. RRM, RBD, or RNP domain)